MTKNVRYFGLLVFSCVALFAAGCARQEGSQAQLVVRAGHFPNITHSQALVGRANGWFQKALSPEARVDWKGFNAGPSLIEALFAGEIDIGVVGPNPAITGYVRSKGEALRVIAGGVSGGASLVVQGDSAITKPEDFRGKKIASPQLGNTQDVALRGWLAGQGLKLKEQGGDVTVLPISNADQLTLFMRKQIDAAWCPEPWASRLIHEANGRLFLDERDLWPERRFVTAHLIVSTKFLKEHRDLVKRWVSAHVELTDWINQHPDEARRLLKAELKAETGATLPDNVLDDAFSRLEVTYDPVRTSLEKMARNAFDLGFLGTGQAPDLSNLYDLSILEEILRSRRN